MAFVTIQYDLMDSILDIFLLNWLYFICNGLYSVS